MEKFRIYLFIGAALVVLSMPLVAMDVNWFGERTQWNGAFLWIMSFLILLSSLNFHVVMFAYCLCAALNIPQLIFPLVSNPERGTSKLFVWSFTFSAFIILPGIALLTLLQPHDGTIFREGFYFYQAGYIVSAIGFHLKRKAFLISEAAKYTYHLE